jgi:hypothetical protein
MKKALLLALLALTIDGCRNTLVVTNQAYSFPGDLYKVHPDD